MDPPQRDGPELYATALSPYATYLLPHSNPYEGFSTLHPTIGKDLSQMMQVFSLELF
jgi:hypothetical protein